MTGSRLTDVLAGSALLVFAAVAWFWMAVGFPPPPEIAVHLSENLLQWLSPGFLVLPVFGAVIASLVGMLLVTHAVFFSAEPI